MPPLPPHTRADCAALDAADPLAFARRRFTLPDGVIYLDGNSLGALPADASARLADVAGRQWGEGLIRSWNDERWIDLPVTLGAAIAPLLGAAPDTVIACDSVSVNLFKLAGAALALRPDRRTILIEADDFPTDAYVMGGLAGLASVRLLRVARADLAAALGPDVALLLLTHTHYATGAVHDMAAMTAAAHAAGALTLWDLSHSAGAMALHLDHDGADFAVGCGYKYLNGGPGAPAFAYVAQRHWPMLAPPLTGWMGHADPFAFAAEYAPAPGVRRLLAGTPPILAMAALASGVATFSGIDMSMAEAKSSALVRAFAALVTAHCPGVRVETPAGRHGCQLVIHHPEGRRIMAALIARGVIGDFRPPDRLRFGFPALYTRFVDVWDATATLAKVLATESWRDIRSDDLGQVC
jgi:kynureninase